MEVGGQLHTLTAVSLGEEPLPGRLRGLQASVDVVTNILASARIQTLFIQPTPQSLHWLGHHILLGMNNEFQDFILLVTFYTCCKRFGTSK
jgi:hypothetical protein